MCWNPDETEMPLAVMCFHTRPWFLLPFSLQWVSTDKSRLIQGSTPSLPCPKTLGHRIGGCLVQQIEIQDRTIWHKCVLCQWFRVTCLTFGHLSHNLIQRVGGNSIERSHQYCRTGFKVGITSSNGHIRHQTTLPLPQIQLSWVLQRVAIARG